MPSSPRAVAAGLALLVLAVYLQTLGHGWVHWDDDSYVFANPRVLAGLSWESLRWAFTTMETATWQPVTLVSYLIDASVWGARPGGYHLTNVLLHAVNAPLLFLWLRRRTGAAGRSAAVAAVFAAHPVNAEVVAWISGRKDLLAALFALLALLAYDRYARRPCLRRAWPAILAFALALAAKPVTMTLPLLFLMLDAGSRRLAGGSWTWPRLFLEKTPLLLLSLGMLALTFVSQSSVGAVSGLGEITPRMRLANAVVSYAAYLRMLAVPARLACFYPYAVLPAAVVAGSAALLAGISALVLRLRRSWPAASLGWSWFLVSLVPTIGLVQVGSQARADRYLYLPMVGIAAAVVWGLAAALRGRRAAPAALAVLAVAVLATLAHRQAATWKDDTSLFGHAARVTRGNHVAENKLGAALDARGDLRGAHRHYAAAVAIHPRYIDGLYNLATAEDRLGRPAEAIRVFRKVLELSPGEPRARRGLAVALTNLGASAAEEGRLEEAIGRFEEALALVPDLAEARANLQRAREERARGKGGSGERRAVEGR